MADAQKNKNEHYRGQKFVEDFYWLFFPLLQPKKIHETRKEFSDTEKLLSYGPISLKSTKETFSLFYRLVSYTYPIKIESYKV